MTGHGTNETSRRYGVKYKFKIFREDRPREINRRKIGSRTKSMCRDLLLPSSVNFFRQSERYFVLYIRARQIIVVRDIVYCI